MRKSILFLLILTLPIAAFAFKKKKTGDATIEFASWRACAFAISALTQEESAKKDWKLASPTDGYKY